MNPLGRDMSRPYATNSEMPETFACGIGSQVNAIGVGSIVPLGENEGSKKTTPGAAESPKHPARVGGCNELRPCVDTSVDAADVGVCVTTSGTGAPLLRFERKANIALVAQVPRPAVSVLLPTPVSGVPAPEDLGRAARVARQPRPHPHFSLLHDLCRGLLGGRAL